jgi:hypothetical protein
LCFFCCDKKKLRGKKKVTGKKKMKLILLYLVCILGGWSWKLSEPKHKFAEAFFKKHSKGENFPKEKKEYNDLIGKIYDSLSRRTLDDEQFIEGFQESCKYKTINFKKHEKDFKRYWENVHNYFPELKKYVVKPMDKKNGKLFDIPTTGENQDPLLLTLHVDLMDSIHQEAWITDLWGGNILDSWYDTRKFVFCMGAMQKATIWGILGALNERLTTNPDWKPPVRLMIAVSHTYAIGTNVTGLVDVPYFFEDPEDDYVNNLVDYLKYFDIHPRMVVDDFGLIFPAYALIPPGGEPPAFFGPAAIVGVLGGGQQLHNLTTISKFDALKFGMNIDIGFEMSQALIDIKNNAEVPCWTDDELNKEMFMEWGNVDVTQSPYKECILGDPLWRANICSDIATRVGYSNDALIYPVNEPKYYWSYARETRALAIRKHYKQSMEDMRLMIDNAIADKIASGSIISKVSSVRNGMDASYTACHTYSDDCKPWKFITEATKNLMPGIKTIPWFAWVAPDGQKLIEAGIVPVSYHYHPYLIEMNYFGTANAGFWLQDNENVSTDFLFFIKNGWGMFIDALVHLN